MSDFESTSAGAKRHSIDSRHITKALVTLMGMVGAIVCDDILNDQEVIFLSTWMSNNEHISREYPANIIYRRVREVLQDGVITENERNHLLNELKILSGTDFSNTGEALPEHISSMFDDDPHVIADGNVFVFTGEFLYGTREYCKRAIEKRGGIASQNVTQQTNYLVVGSRSSPDWITQNFGRKMQKAAEMQQSGDYAISIVRESDWVMIL